MREEITTLIDELRSFDCSIKLSDSGGIKLVAKDQSVLPAELIARIKENKAELIEYLQSAIQTNELKIVKVPIQKSYPISDAQRRLWVLSQFTDSSRTYNLPGQVRINERVDIESFKKAVNAVIDRHEVLRTAIKPDDNGNVRQWILDIEDLGFEMDYNDLRNETLKEEIAQSYIAEDSFKEYDFEKAPLLRAALLQLEDNVFIFYFNMHHIISDAWSSAIMIKEVASFYESFKLGRTPQLEELTIQYKDYSVWQLNQLVTESFQNHRDYWLKTLKGELPILDLPRLKKRPKLKTNSGYEVRTFVDQSVTERLKNYSNKNNGSNFTTLLAVWNVLFYRYSGQKDIVLGTPVAGRENKDLENQIGLYVNTLVLRNQISSNQRFDDFHNEVKNATLTALSHQMYPFDRLIEELDIEREVGRSAVFDVMVSFNSDTMNSTSHTSKMSYSSDVEDIGECLSKFEVSIAMTEMDKVLSVNIVYNPDVYEHQMIKQLLTHFKLLLSRLLENPNEEIDSVKFLSNEEEQELLVSHNQSSLTYPKDRNFINLFEDQVSKNRDALAVVFEDSKLTYGELDEKSNQIAHYLHANHKIEANDLIGIKLPRSEWMIILLIGILKAGGAYVPIDPEFPVNGIKRIEQDVNWKFCFDEKTLFEVKHELSNYSKDKIDVEHHIDQLMYVVYTSGSTGDPKGVMVGSLAIVDYVFGLLEKTNYANCQTFGHVSTFSADLGNTIIYPALLTGGTIHLIPKEDFLNADKLMSLNLDCIKMTPSHWKYLKNNAGQYMPEKCLILGGEIFTEDIVETLRAIKQTAEVYNHYGPSETTIGKLIKRVDLEKEDSAVPIGTIMGENRVYVLNDKLQLCPKGVVGEIFLGGVGLAKGYLNDQTLTNTKFVEDPFEKGKLIYATGDFGRWLPDGDIDFIGRKDEQVKIRGYRIEMKNIELAFRKNEEILEVIVTNKQNDQGEQELILYYSAKKPLSISYLQASVKQDLPNYMLPSHYVQIEKIPLTTNGKVDKKLLPHPSGFKANSRTHYEAPTSTIAKKVVSLWESILSKEPIGLKDDFFILGGHSLKAIRLINLYQKSFDVKLTMNQLFVNATVDSHIDLIQSASKTNYMGIPSLTAAQLLEGSQMGFAISDAQRRLWVLSQFEESSVAYNIPSVTYLNEDLNIENFRKAVLATIDRHEILRTVFRENQTGEPRQWIIPVDQFEFKTEIVDLSTEQNSEQLLNDHIQKDAAQPFDLENGPLIRTLLFQTGENHYAFYHNVHHIISDGWSKDVLSADVSEFYQAYEEGRPPYLKELNVQYKEFSAWQLARLAGDDFEEDRLFWLNTLAGEIPVLQLPTSKKRPKLKSHAGRSLSIFIGKEDARRLQKYSQENGGSLFMGLLAVWNVLMYHYTGQKELITGTATAGREHPDLENQIGFYVNPIALRNEINPTDNFNDLFETIRENTVNSFDHQKYPFDHLVEELQLQRDTSRSVIFDVIFSLVNAKDEDSDFELDFDDLNQIRDNGSVQERYDMTVMFKELGESIAFILNYNTDIYERDLVESVMMNFKRLLSRVLDAPQETLGSLNFLSEAEEKRLKLDKNDTKVDYRADQTVLDLFYKQVERVPDQVAIEFDGRQLTYKELDKKSSDLALCLLDQFGLEINDAVGIFIDRSDWFLISVMATLKAGAAYVPIDTRTTLSRQEYSISDIQPKVLLICSESMFDILEFDVEAFSVDLQLSEWIEANPSPALSLATIQPSQLAYVIYTSGSTGTPKGVEVTHGNLYNYISWAKSAYLGESDPKGNFGLYSSPSFDLTVTSLFLPLIAGSTLHIYSPEMEIMEILADYFSTETSMDVIKLTPAHVLLLDYLDLEKTNVKTAIVGGEELRSNHVQILRRLNPQMRIFNEYGPTECTVGCTVCEVEDADAITIGKPIANTQAYIVNEYGNLQPEGVVGELLIGGLGVTRGYFNQAEQTDARFVSPPFLEDGARVYRTGDLARWLTNGELSYLGRNDDQVKIRGYRVELGEISNTIISNTSVESAAVRVISEGDDKTLVAFYVPDSANAYTLRQSLIHAQKDLPERMELNELPNGMLMYAYNKTELHFVFDEIFGNDIYLKHGIQIPDNACVFDVGANDGMFSLYAHLAAKNVRVHAFEPLPPTFELLKHNTELYEGNYTVHKYGLARKEETAQFSYFPNATVLSTRYHETNEVESIVKKFIQNGNDNPDLNLADEELDTLLDHRLIRQEYTCQLKALSDVIAEEGIEKIDLLKVDVEKSELDVLEGINSEDWKKIQQIVIEVHDDTNNRLSYIIGLLEDHEYHVIVHQSEDAQGTNLYDLYARKKELITSESDNSQQKIRAVSCRSAKEIEQELKEQLERKLPEYMVPNQFIAMASLPLTVNGKIDTDKLLKIALEKIAVPVVYTAPRNEYEQKLSQLWQEVLKRENISIDNGFFVEGGDSMKLIELNFKISKEFGSGSRIADLYKYTTIRQQADMLMSEKSDDPMRNDNSLLSEERSTSIGHEDIAVIGMAIRAPKSKDVQEYWENLKAGNDLITHFSIEELLAAGVAQHDLDHPNYVRSNSFLANKEYFDSAFFGYLPDEASLMDPQTRIFHEVVWSALDDAGYDPRAYRGRIGLFAGASENTIWEIYSMMSNDGKVDTFRASHLSSRDFSNTLIANRLNLKGPVNLLTTACSTSLVTIHEAVKSLLTGECHIAIAGGTSVKNKKLEEGYWNQEGMIHSKDGKNRTFDKEASGTIGSEGSGAVVLKRLSQAIQDGDQVYAVIKGSAVNNDGDRKVGYTAPSVNGQAEVIQLALENANVSPESISYVEAHGTATNIGDPIEMLGLLQAFGKSNEKYCAVGSVKSNVGHMDSAAGVAGFIKTVLCLKNRQLVPSIHFTEPNPEINFEESPFFVNTTFKEWSVPNGPLRAGVSSFGIGGTNAHIILEEAPNLAENDLSEGHELIVLSAKSKASLLRQQIAMKNFFEANLDLNLGNIAWTLQNRAAFDYRSSFVASTVSKTVDALNQEIETNQHYKADTNTEMKIAFLFSGQGSQYQNMGRDLYSDEESVFRKTMDSCFQIASKYSDVNFREILYPLHEAEDDITINQTANTQPILFIFEYALAAQLGEYGITPSLMLGHSIGEYVAACIAGVLSWEDALKLVIKRGELMQKLPKGAMLAVGLTRESVAKYLTGEIDIAAINTPNSCVLSGPTVAIQDLAATFEKEGIVAKELHTSHAFHSSMMDPILEEFTRSLEQVKINPPSVPYLSNLTGKMITSQELSDKEYWARHIRNAVRFSEGVNELLSKDDLQIIEIGPGDTLINMARQHVTKEMVVELNSVVRHVKVEQDDKQFLLKSLSKMWNQGLHLNWEKLHTGKIVRKIALPTYSFEKIKFPDGYFAHEFVFNGINSTNDAQRLNEKDWYYEPIWKSAKLRPNKSENQATNAYLVFCDELGVGTKIIDQIESNQGEAIAVFKGEEFKQMDESSFQINPARYTDYEALFSGLKQRGLSAVNIIHLFTITQETEEDIAENMTLGYYSLLHITKELQKLETQEEIIFRTITNRSERVFDEDKMQPSKGMMSGMNIVITQENPHIKTKIIDLDSDGIGAQEMQTVWLEIQDTSDEKLVAYRKGKRWTKGYSPIDLSAQTIEAQSAFTQGGTYLLTGGLGGLGFLCAQHLLEKYDARLILLGRSNLENSSSNEKARRLAELQSKGKVVYYQADLADLSATKRSIEQGEEECGEINGIIHAAGNVSQNSFHGINFLNPDNCRDQFIAKIEGTNVLTKLFEGRQLDFCLFTSSLASIVGGKEFGAYASANSYLDYYSQVNRIANSLSINFDGLAVNHSNADGSALDPSEIIRVIETALLSRDTQLAVSLTDLNARIKKWVYPQIVEDQAHALWEDDFQSFERPSLSNAFIEPETITEKDLCNLLESFFGLKAIGVEDDFFELGGDSLKAMTVISRIHQKFNVQLQIREVMQNANVRNLANEIDLRLKMNEMEQLRLTNTFDNKIEL